MADRCVVRAGAVGLGLAALAGGLLPAGANPGDLDGTFGGDGVVVLASDEAYEFADDVVVLDDGRIVIAGPRGDTTRVLVARLLPDGSPDATFDDDGVVTAGLADGEPTAIALAVQDDGKILTAGPDYGANHEAVVFRFNQDGSLDDSFGDAGAVVFDAADGVGGLDDVLALPDGKILVAGALNIGGTFNLEVTRLLEDGSVDVTFADEGSFIRAGVDSAANALAVAPDGAILVAGAVENGLPVPPETNPTRNALLVRLLADGTLDEDFGAGGEATLSLAPADNSAIDLKVQPDAKIVIGGYLSDADTSSFVAARFEADGSLDTSFGDDGVLTTGEIDDAEAVVLQPDGRIVLAGDVYPGDTSNLAVLRLNPDGTVDDTFGDGGVAAFEDLASYSSGQGAALAPDGSIVVVGYRETASDVKDIVLVRLVGQTTRCDGQLVTLDAALSPDGPVEATAGDDVILGTQGADEIDALAGNDRVCSRGGSDTITAGPGADLVIGGGGADTATGGGGPDDLRGGRGSDSLSGGRGPDNLNGGRGSDTCTGGRGADTLASCES